MMHVSSRTASVPALVSALLIGASLVAGSLAPGPAAADIRRSCDGVLTISTTGGTTVRHDLRAWMTERNRVYANRARERSRAAIYACMRDHWAQRMTSSRPASCQQVGGYGYIGFSQEMTAEICAANPGRQSFLVNVRIAVTGDTGCTVNNDWAGVELAHGYRVYCWTNPGEVLH